MKNSLFLLLAVLMISCDLKSCQENLNVNVPEMDETPPKLSWQVGLPTGITQTYPNNGVFKWNYSSPLPVTAAEYTFQITLIATDPESGVRSISLEGSGATNCGVSCSGYERIFVKEAQDAGAVKVGQPALKFLLLNDQVNMMCRRIPGKFYPQSITPAGGQAQLIGRAINQKGQKSKATFTIQLNTFPDECD